MSQTAATLFGWSSIRRQDTNRQGAGPALILSPKAYNQTTSLALACPVTSKVKGYPFEILLPAGLKVAGVVLSDQMKSLDWRARKASFADRARGGSCRRRAGETGNAPGMI